MKKISIFLMMLCFACFGVANAQQSLPYSYGFENYDLSADGWTTANPYSSNTSEFGIAAAAKHNGDFGFRFSSYSRNNAGYDQYLISPELDGARGVIMSFWYAASSTSGTELFKVGYSTTDTNISSFTWGSEISTNSTSWAQSEEYMFPAGTKYVAIWYYSNYQYRLFVDDFSFAAVPSCVRPTLSNEVILGMENASVQWTENGTATNWELQYSTNADFSGATTINRNGIPAYAISDLSAATTYYARVRANCGGGDYSDWSNVISFTTWACENATAVEYNLADSYGDGWNGNAIQIFDGCGDLVETLTIASGTTNSGTLSLCGDYYQFVWHTGSYANETSFTLTVNGTALYSQQSGGSLTDGQVLHTIGIQPPVMPTDLTAGTPGADQVQLSWTENGTATTWQICINDDENNLVVANSNPFTLTGLNALTAYTVKVRSTDGTNASCWSNVVSFTTDSSCPTPTNLTVTNLMPTSATLNWEGDDDAESYNVRYRVAGGDVTIFEDGFENGLDNWTIYTQGEAPNADGWVTYDASGINGVTNHGGSYVVSAWSWASNAYNADNWLVTPQIELQGNLKFWETTAGQWPDSYEVLLSTSDNSISDFTITLREMQQATGDWSEVVIDLSSYAGQQGYIAIHHVSYDANYLFIDDFGIYGTQDAGEWINATSTTNSLDITGLSSLKNYEFQVQAVCGTDDESGWSDIANFPTPDGCAVPTDLTADVTGNAAELSWTGTTETYNLQYLEVDPTVPATIILNIPTDVWGDGSGYQMLIDADATAYGTIIPETGGLTSSGDASAETYAEFEYKLPTNADGSCTTTNILVEGSISIEIPAGTYDWCITNPTPSDRIWIASSNGNVGGRQDDYVFEPGTTYEFTIHVSGTNDAVDVTITDNNEWTLVEGVNNPYILENLSAQATYKYKVQGVDCDGNGGNTNWSASASFTTGEFYVKHITGYGETDGNWYLIASPLADNVDPASVGMITDDLGTNATPETSTYDLYSFDQTQDMEWRNYRVNSFELVNGQGYLYAHKTDIDLVFTGTATSGTTQEVTLHKTAESDGLDFPAWNLVGNPFAVIAYPVEDYDFYTLSGDATLIVEVNDDFNSIEAMEGIFVNAENDGDVLTFTTSPTTKTGKGFVLNLSQNHGLIDRAVVRFGEGRTLPKFQIKKNSTKVYIPMDGQDYAVVRSEEVGEMPVSFKAEENGNYTLSLSALNTEFGYMHLIDNLTGNDVDLLKTPSYSFEAKTTDYESRFKLVFATGNNGNDDNFAFFSNGSFVINNEGEATLQVIDVTGRILKSENINGCANVNVNAAPGVYMLRLINGDNMKVQKVVVR
jgi:hypothetical protein